MESKTKQEIELNENALLMGFMADFGRKITEQLKTERSAPSESLSLVAASESELTDPLDEPTARSQENEKDQIVKKLQR